MERIHDILISVNETLTNAASKIYKKQKYSELKNSDAFPESTKDKLGIPKTAKGEDEEDFTKVDEMEMMEYKTEFFEMSVGSIKAICSHAESILAALNNPVVKENLTESWLQGKIAITEDYMRTIHDFVMFVSEDSDSTDAGDKPGLWDNIRKKKEREGKNYKPAKPGDKDRPDSEQWKKLTKENKKK